MPDETLRDSIEKAFAPVEKEKDDVSAEKPVAGDAEKPAPKEEKPVITDDKPVDTDVGGDGTPKLVDDAAKDTPKKEKEVKSKEVAKKDLKAPVSWRPAAREQWAALPDGIKEEILKREEDVKKVNDGKAVDGQFRSQFESAISPFRGFIEANGGNPLASIRNLLSTAATLHGGTQSQKAELVKNIIKNFSVDIETLDKVLAGEAPPKSSAQMPDISGLLNKELAPIREFIGSIQGGQQQRNQALVSEFFANPKFEFAHDLANEMADLMEVSARQGREMSLEQAYDKAVRLNPEVSKVVGDRELISKKTTEQDDLKKKQLAASSVAGSPGGIPASVDTKRSLRGDIEAAFSSHSGR
jgi:hypothetical protein